MPHPLVSPHHLTVGSEDAGTRLDKFLSLKLPQYSRSRLQALIGSAQVQCGAATLTDASAKVKPGMEITVTVPKVVDLPLKPLHTQLDIIFEDEHILVINKAAGMTVHPAPGHADDTLVNALLAHCKDSLSGIGGVARPGIVHRIDKDTSGLLVVAKHDKAHHSLAAQLKNRTLKRTYFAVVWGVPSPRSGKIEGNIGRSPRNRQKMAVLKKGGKEAATHYKTLETFTPPEKKIPIASLVECNLETGRTHQIRVHMAHIGHALLGDATYGRPKNNINLQEDIKKFPRQALHAAKLALSHPITGKTLVFEAPLPPDMHSLIDSLRRLP